MAAIAAITAFDQDTVHNFTPALIRREGRKNIAEYREHVTGVPLDAQNKVILSIEELPSGVRKVDVEVLLPVQETVGTVANTGYVAAPKVAYELRAKCTFFYNPRSVESDRLDLRHIMANILTNKATLTTPNTAGQLADLIDRVIAPT